MKSKFHVSLEAARLLKEKGYKEKVWHFYYVKDNYVELLFGGAKGKEHNYNESVEVSDAPDLDFELYSAPTKAEAIDWLESKGIIVELSYDDQGHKDNARWDYFIYTHDKDGWVKAMVCSWTKNNYYKTRLEAEEAAIIKACELL